MPLIKIDKPLVNYTFWQFYEMTLITMSPIYGKILTFLCQKYVFKIILESYDKLNLIFVFLHY